MEFHPNLECHSARKTIREFLHFLIWPDSIKDPPKKKSNTGDLIKNSVFNILKAAMGIPQLASRDAISFLLLFTVTSDYFYVTFPHVEIYHVSIYGHPRRICTPHDVLTRQRLMSRHFFKMSLNAKKKKKTKTTLRKPLTVCVPGSSV